MHRIPRALLAAAALLLVAASASAAPAAPVRQADLSIAKTASASQAVVDDEIAYNITVSNAGPDRATQVVVTDALPEGVAFVSASAGCTRSGSTVTCQLGSVNKGATSTITIRVRAEDAGNQTDVATVGGAEEDPDASNNAASATTRVVTQPPRSVSCVAHGSSVRITWTSVPQATGYNVYRATGSGSFVLVGSTTSISYDDGTVAPGQTYRYKVTAVSAGGESAGSDTCTAMAVPLFGSAALGALALAGCLVGYVALRRR
ncbi:MAG TPA: hypothetical protein VHH36_07055 [Candidatus Thermoplasmatota archaeon]|nr:hypothetical protein [Candidatus Thermoplasmatota archaeon]